MYGSHTLITMYGSHISMPHIFHTGFSTCFSYLIFHTLHMWIIWELTQESYTFHTWIILECYIGITCFKNTHMWKLLTCGEDINVATIQLLCGYHTTPMWLPYRNYCVPHGSCMVGTWELYGSHMLPNTLLMCRGFSHTAPIWLHTTLMWLPHSFCMTTIQL